MSKQVHKKKAQVLLAFAQTMVETPGLTWVDASNAIYGPGGPYGKLFPTKLDRQAFDKMAESKQVDNLIYSLPEPPVRPMPKEYSGKFNVRIPKSLHAALAEEADAEGVSLNQLVLTKLSRNLKQRY